MRDLWDSLEQVGRTHVVQHFATLISLTGPHRDMAGACGHIARRSCESCISRQGRT